MTTPRLSRSGIAAGAAALGALGAIGIAQLAGGSTPIVNFTQAAASGSTSTTVAGQAAPANGQRPARPAKLDAETEPKVKAAAEAAVEGSTYQHGHKNRDATGYKALVTKADGTRVLVNLDNDFKVTSIEDPAPARGPRGGHDRAPLDAETDAKVKAAALEAVPGATYDHGHKTPDGYVAELTKADGTTRVLVHEDANFTVTKVEDPAPARGPGGPRHEQLDEATNAKVKAAAEAAVAGSTYQFGHKNRDGSGYKALVTKADGTKVLVEMDNEFKVTNIQDPAPARPEGGRGGRGHGGPPPEGAPAPANADNAA